jgi:hypothetical protein
MRYRLRENTTKWEELAKMDEVPRDRILAKHESADIVVIQRPR